MIRLALRLTVNGGKEALARLVILAIAVALGVGMLLITLAAINAVNAQNDRYAWLETRADSTGTAAPAWWRLSADQFHGRLIGRIDVAATGPSSPIPPGIARLPGPGQFYASPAMGALLRSIPADELGSRYPGRQIGTIGLSALPAPDSLLVVVGHRPDQLAHMAGAEQVTRISTTPPSSCSGPCYFIGIDAAGIDLVLSVTAAAVLFPVLIFIGTATRLSAARREQRFAAMRLVGATPRQVAVISAVESTVAAVAGMAAGFVIFVLLRPVLARIPFTGARFFASDLSLNPLDVVLVSVGVPVAAAVAARLALRRVSISPLGVSRRVTPSPPRAWRLIPLLAGIAELAWFVVVGRPESTPGAIEAYLGGILLMMAGIVIAGPWLTMVGARIVSRRTNSPDVLIAGRRLDDNPKAGFRAISGVVLALFVTSVAIAVITTIDAYDAAPPSSSAVDGTLFDEFTVFANSGQPTTSIPSLQDGLVSRIRAIPGVQAVTVVHAAAASDTFAPGVVSCAQLARTPALGRCAAGADTATIEPHFGARDSTHESTVWPAATWSSAQLASLPVQSVAVATNGSHAAIERARTALEQAYPVAYFPATIAEQRAQNPNKQLDAQYRRLVDVVILATLPIAGCSLAVSVVAGLAERRRPFSLLRLTGVPLSLLRRVVAFESAVPLLVMSALSIVTGFLAAGLFLKSQLHETLQPPGAGYFLIVALGLVASLAIIASTLPVLERITGPETARND